VAVQVTGAVQSADLLLRQADAAMYRHKQHGRRSVRTSS
jgi:GGDEF domain-containing protein